MCFLADAMLSGSDDSCAEVHRQSLAESFANKWIPDSGDSFDMTHSADQFRIGDNHLII